MLFISLSKRVSLLLPRGSCVQGLDMISLHVSQRALLARLLIMLHIQKATLCDSYGTSMTTAAMIALSNYLI